MSDFATPQPNVPASVSESTPEGKTAQGEAVTLDRLNSQIAWYDRRSARNRSLYKCLKTVIIAAAAAIPVLTTAGLPHGPMVAAR